MSTLYHCNTSIHPGHDMTMITITVVAENHEKAAKSFIFGLTQLGFDASCWDTMTVTQYGAGPSKMFSSNDTRLAS